MAFLLLGTIGGEISGAWLLSRGIKDVAREAPREEHRLRHLQVAAEQLRRSLHEAQARPLAFRNQFDRGAEDAADENLQDRIRRRQIIRAVRWVALALFLGAIAVVVADAEPIPARQQPLNAAACAVIDVTKSSEADLGDGRTAVEANADSIAAFLGSVNELTAIRVLAASDESYERPYFYIKTVSPERGAFGKSIINFRRDLLTTWTAIRHELLTDFETSDLIGAVLQCAHFFEQQQVDTKFLLLASDMRQSGALRGIDMETVERIDVESVMAVIRRNQLLASLPEVRVACVNAYTIGRSPAHWSSLKNMWQTYFQESGAVLITFTSETFMGVQ